MLGRVDPDLTVHWRVSIMAQVLPFSLHPKYSRKHPSLLILRAEALVVLALVVDKFGVLAEEAVSQSEGVSEVSEVVVEAAQELV